LYNPRLAEGPFREPPFDPESGAKQLARWSESLEGADLARWAGRLDQTFSPRGGSVPPARSRWRS